MLNMSESHGIVIMYMQIRLGETDEQDVTANIRSISRIAVSAYTRAASTGLAASTHTPNYFHSLDRARAHTFHLYSSTLARSAQTLCFLDTPGHRHVPRHRFPSLAR